MIKIDDEQVQIACYQLNLESNLYLFAKDAWQWIDNATLEDAFHIKVICDHLQAAYEGRFNRFAISIPPSFAKSILVSVIFPAWVWANDPSKQFLTGSNSSDLSARDTVRTRELINSDWYQFHWGYKFKFASDQNEKTNYKNDKHGHRYAFSTGARITGHRADIIIVDDGLNYNDRRSKAKQEQVNNLISGGLSTRYNNEATSLMIIVGQRLGKNDPIGHLLSKKWGVHLNLPLEGNPEKACVTPLFKDPRKKGESLWPSRWTKEVIAAKKTEVGSRDFATQYNQEPRDEDEAIFHDKWFKYYREKPKFTKIIDSWDTSFGQNEKSDWSACTTWGQTKDGHYLIDAWHGRVKFPELKRKMIEINAKHGSNEILVENKASGVSSVQELQATTRLPLKLLNPIKDKLTRADASVPTFEAGKILFPELAKWLHDLKEEMLDFPDADHDDWVDTISQYIIYSVKPRNFDRLFSVVG